MVWIHDHLSMMLRGDPNGFLSFYIIANSCLCKGYMNGSWGVINHVEIEVHIILAPVGITVLRSSSDGTQLAETCAHTQTHTHTHTHTHSLKTAYQVVRLQVIIRMDIHGDYTHLTTLHV